MTTLEPIRQENQIEDLIFNVETDITEKIEQLKENVNNVLTVNGSKVYNVTVIENDVWYNRKNRKDGKLVYYYPIQYAEITFK